MRALKYYYYNSDEHVIAEVMWSDGFDADDCFGAEIKESDLPVDFKTWALADYFEISKCACRVYSLWFDGD